MAMIKKDQMVPGVKLKIRDVIKDGTSIGIPGMTSNNVLPHVRMMAGAGSMLDGHRAIRSGDIVEVVDKPRRRDGINTIVVRTADGTTGHVYWCEMRASSDIA